MGGDVCACLCGCLLVVGRLGEGLGCLCGRLGLSVWVCVRCWSGLLVGAPVAGRVWVTVAGLRAWSLIAGPGGVWA